MTRLLLLVRGEFVIPSNFARIVGKFELPRQDEFPPFCVHFRSTMCRKCGLVGFYTSFDSTSAQQCAFQMQTSAQQCAESVVWLHFTLLLVCTSTQQCTFFSPLPLNNVPPESAAPHFHSTMCQKCGLTGFYTTFDVHFHSTMCQGRSTDFL